MFEDILSSRFYAVSVGITRIMYVTVLFLLFSLPLLTIGVSLTALIATIRQPEYKAFGVFWETFKDNLLRGSVVLLFTGFTVMFLFQAWHFIGVLPAGNVIFIFLTVFLIVYNLNAYLFVSLLKKCNITFFRQVFFFTIGTLYKTFLIPLIAAALSIVAPIIGGWPLLILSISMVLTIYVKLVEKDLEVVEDYL
ncbi:MAG: DUF624 domain-containing protein [Turicibacter sp.]|nr:DUF624 domain-containing protein [Turicibacter sp.]